MRGLPDYLDDGQATRALALGCFGLVVGIGALIYISSN